MKKLILVLFAVLALCLLSVKSWSGFNINPTSRTELNEILRGLADDHAYKQWCESHCGQIHRIRLSGRIENGQLDLEVWGHIVGEDNGVLPLFGAVPVVEILDLKNGTADIPLIYKNKSYFTLLPPGAFYLKGQIRIDRTSSTNFTLPGAVGKIDLDIEDQEELLKTQPMGQVGGSFQIVSMARDLKTQAEPKRDLRLRITRNFYIARDKTFTYSVHVVGAKAGQVIVIPIQHAEKVFQTEPQNARLADDKIEFTATGPDNRFTIYGEWTKKDIALKAASGSMQEIWAVECEGAYDCVFEGNVDKSIGVTGHQWEPKSGNELKISWKELGILHGQSIVAEEVLLDSRFNGETIQQNFSVRFMSSSSDQLLFKLPEKSIPTALYYDNVQSPVLKNDQGLVHITVPQGQSLVKLDWEIPEYSSSSVPLPELGVPISKWTFWTSPNRNDIVVYTGGLSGSPVVLFWPRVGFCLFVALLFLWFEKKLTGKSVTNRVLFVLMSVGMALGESGVILFLVGFLTMIRFLGRVKEQRTVFGWILEWGVLLGLIVATFGTSFDVLDTAFFSEAPLRYDQFCQDYTVLSQSRPSSAMCWETTLLPHTQTLKSPLMLSVPLLAIRVVYFVWAILVGGFLYLEFRNLWESGKSYFAKGRRLVIKPRKPV